MPRAGLVAVRKVRSDGASQRYWVDPKKLRRAIGAKGYAGGLAAIKAAGGDPKRADKLIDAWRESSTEHGALKLRGAALNLAAESMGLGPEETQAMIQEDIDDAIAVGATKFTHPEDPTKDRTPEQSFSDGWKSAETRGTVEAMAATSQSMYDEDEIDVYRGIGPEQAAEAASGEVDVGSLVSFTEDAKVARRFAGATGAVIKTRVPRSSIVISHRAFRGKGGKGLLGPEKEVVVLTTGRIGISVVPQ